MPKKRGGDKKKNTRLKFHNLFSPPLHTPCTASSLIQDSRQTRQITTPPRHNPEQTRELSPTLNLLSRFLRSRNYEPAHLFILSRKEHKERLSPNSPPPRPILCSPNWDLHPRLTRRNGDSSELFTGRWLQKRLRFFAPFHLAFLFSPFFSNV